MSNNHGWVLICCYFQALKDLGSLGLDGPHLSRTIQEQLKREDQWVKWKNTGCKDWTLPYPDSTKWSGLGKAADKGGKSAVRAEELVWNSKKKQRKSVKRYCNAVVEDQYLAGKGGEFMPSVEGISDSYSYPTVKVRVLSIVNAYKVQNNVSLLSVHASVGMHCTGLLSWDGSKPMEHSNAIFFQIQFHINMDPMSG